MSNWLTDGAAKTVGSLVDSLGGLFDRFIHTKGEKAQFMLEAEKIAQLRLSELEQSYRVELEAKQKVIQAEMANRDKFTKRARPMVVYVGLGAIVINYVLFPILAWVTLELTGSEAELPVLDLPAKFWWAWTSVCSVWAIGRTQEKLGSTHKSVRAITGHEPIDLLK